MLPEKWNKLCLYASVIDEQNSMQTGEMFFYYFPSGILRKKQINVYEVPERFGIDENQYIRFANSLYNTIKKLKKVCVQHGERPWSNITIIIEKHKYKAIYGYEDLTACEFDSTEMKTIWVYENLSEPYESFSKSERETILRYKQSNKTEKDVFELPLYNKGMNSKLYKVKTLEDNVKFVREEKMQEIEEIKTHIPKSQILNMK